MSIEKMFAASNAVYRWDAIDFHAAKKSVKKLQKRIAEAFGDNDVDRFAGLQCKLIHSFYAKALAVKAVTSTRGKYTPGIDFDVWSTPGEKLSAIFSLSRRGYKPKPLKRIYIPKPSGGVRPLSIPTMKDRAMQTLYRFALEPIAELTGDEHSYGFRPKRSARDAVQRCIDVLSMPPSPRYILKADIQSCFDNIDHDWVMEHIPMDKTVLRKFLKCGYIRWGTFYPMERGVPQGGSISSVICNMVLDGLEALLKKQFAEAVNMIRYADDIIIISDCPTLLVQSVVPELNCFLLERGLQLSREKTKVVAVKDGFVFLGFGIRKDGDDIVAIPARKGVDSLTDKVCNALSVISTVPLDSLPSNSIISLGFSLQYIIRGWCNYYRGIATPSSLCEVQSRLAALAEQLTGDVRIADFIHKNFEKNILREA